MKSHTDISQSKKLAEILPLESADMTLVTDLGGEHLIGIPYIKEHEDLEELRKQFGEIESQEFPCWSLAALLNVLPNDFYATTTLSKGDFDVDLMKYKNDWVCDFEPELGSNYHTTSADNPVDACYKMIIKLHEQNLL